MTYTSTPAVRKLREKLGHSHSKSWNQQNPEKRRAQKIVEVALLKGSLTRQPCERCGETIRIQAHHDDYSKPLEIMWLCQKHHKERHKELKAMQCEEMAATA